MKVCLLLLALVAACGGASTPQTAAPAATYVASTSTPTVTPVLQVTTVPTISPAPHLTVSPTPSPTPIPVLVLEPDGLGYLVGSSSVRHLVFHSLSREEIVQVVTRILGTGKTAELPDCGQGPRSSWQAKGLSLLFDGTKWLGWTDQGPAGRTAVNGVGVGVTRAFLDKSGTAFSYSHTSLGTEFLASGDAYGGILSGPLPTSKVTTMYAGETCFFR
ncbi:MAG: hypothetical protein JWO12_515 [Frankiales bacterium]|nr:hypothetical protein [Frankiales bacterium]